MEIASKNKNLLTTWFLWHFYEMPQFLWEVWKNFILFSVKFFSTSLLLKTLFSPWRKYYWSYPRGFDLKAYFEAFFSNFISRVLGAIVRLVFMAVGFIFQIFILFAGAIMFLLWLFFPFLLIGGLLIIFSI